MHKSFKWLFISMLFISTLSFGQTTKLTPKQKIDLIAKMGNLIKEKYVFPQKTEKIIKYLEKKHTSNTFMQTNDPLQFARLMNRYLKKASNDLHLWVGYNPQEAKSHQVRNYSKYLEEKARSKNYGFRKVEILEGNIGYLHMNHFYNPRYSEQTLASAIHFLSNCDALIIDLRKNLGGSIYMVNTLTSYFFDSEILTHRFYYRSGREQEVFTRKDLVGKSLPKIPLYLLVDHKTASAAEQVAYNLKHLKRATIIGEVTIGSANTGLRHSLDNNFYIFIANGAYQNEVTGDTFENKGVIPQVKTKSEKALSKAHILALRQRLKLCKEKSQKKKLNELIKRVKKSTK